MRIRHALVILLGAAGSEGCGPPYHMDMVAVPRPFVRPNCRAVLEPIHTEQLMVGGMPEGAYVASKKDSSAESYMNDKANSAAKFQARLMEEDGFLFAPGGAPDNTFTIRPTWTHWEPGFYAYVAARSSEADFMVDVLGPNGQVLDRFDFTVYVAANIYNPSTGGRMGSALKRAGAIVARYINDNWLCAAH